ncbi:MAG: hypothetical protein WBP42_06835 [Candidatus Zixiibacteriota bacterium]
MKSFSLLNKLARGAAVALMLAFAFGISGCGDDSISGGGDYFVDQIVSTPTSEVDKGSTVVVEALVTDADGLAMSGKAVTFSVSPTSLGYFTPTTDTSDANGLVASLFTAASSGNATLTATVGGNSLSKTLRINESAVSTGRVTLVLNPALMTANGADSAHITISAVNNDNTPVDDGTIIYLVAGERFIDRDQDGYFSNGIDSLLFDSNANNVWDPIGSIPSTVSTVGGQATATYFAGSQATTVYIRATLVGGNQYDYTEISAKLNPNTTVASITLTHNGEDLRVKGVGGIEFSLVTATAYDEFGNTVPEGIPVDFTIANGPNGGENIQSQGYGPVAVNTNSQGKATVTVYSGTIAGTIRLRASSGTVLSAVTHLTVNAGPPAHITVGVANLNIRAWDVVNAQNHVSANVSDIWGNPVPDSTAVYFSTEEGFVQAEALTGTAWPDGIAEVDWYSGNPRNDGIVWIYASTSGGTVADTGAFIASGPSYYVDLIAYPGSLNADGEDKAPVIVQVRDINTNWVVANTPVTFKTDFGTLNGGSTQDGWANSLFEGDFVSEVLKRDYSPVAPDDGVGAVAIVRVQAGGVVGPGSNFQTLFLTGNTYTGNSDIIIDAEVEPGSTVPFSVVVKDRSGNPLGGHSLQIAVSIGSVSASPMTTDSYGEVNLFYTAPASIGACIITVTDLDPRGDVSFAKKIKIKNEE